MGWVLAAAIVAALGCLLSMRGAVMDRYDVAHNIAAMLASFGFMAIALFAAERLT